MNLDEDFPDCRESWFMKCISKWLYVVAFIFLRLIRFSLTTEIWLCTLIHLSKFSQQSPTLLLHNLNY